MDAAAAVEGSTSLAQSVCSAMLSTHFVDMDDGGEWGTKGGDLHFEGELYNDWQARLRLGGISG